METRIYPYLGEQNIGVKGPKGLFKIVERNIEEYPIKGMDLAGLVEVEEGKFVKFERDRFKSYLTTKNNSSKEYEGVDFLRYGVCTQSLWKKDSLNFQVRNYLPHDETGILKCFKKIYYGTHSSKNKALIHGSLVEISGKGILIFGKCWSGKTSLTLGFLEKLNAKFISDGNTLVSYENGTLKGYYLPRPVFVRFSSINSSDRLGRILNNFHESEAIQSFDHEAINEIISNKKFSLDAGLNFSRKKFSDLLEIETKPSFFIHKVIYTNFKEKGGPLISNLDFDEGFNLISQREFPKDTSIGNIKNQRDLERPTNSIINPFWFKEIEKKKIYFNSEEDLTKSLLEELI